MGGFIPALLLTVGLLQCGGSTGEKDGGVNRRLKVVLPPFEEAMGDRAIQWGWWSQDDKTWVALLQELYSKNLVETVPREREDGATRIPKIIHQACWHPTARIKIDILML